MDLSDSVLTRVVNSHYRVVWDDAYTPKVHLDSASELGREALQQVRGNTSFAAQSEKVTDLGGNPTRCLTPVNASFTRWRGATLPFPSHTDRMCHNKPQGPKGYYALAEKSEALVLLNSKS